MSEANKVAMLRIYEEIFGQGNLVAVDELIAADVVEHEEFPGMVPGREGFKQLVAGLRAAFPDLQLVEHDMIAEGDKVAARFVMRGTHRGPFMGVGATGKQVTVTGTEIVRFAGGKAVEHWGTTDALGLMQQLGALPPMG
jgi:steroid delta-isomerase-like uncharacterized protein